MGERSRAAADEVAAAGLGGLLERWQETGEPAALEVLVVAVRPLVEAVAVRVLRSRRIIDRSAVDDVVSLVFDHLRRLPRGLEGERPVAVFRHAAPGTDGGGHFIRLLARNRSLDVARRQHRQHRHERPFSAADAATCSLVRDAAATRDDTAAEADLHDRLTAAIERLAPELRTIVKLLLEGKSQAVIAHVLGVCAGTASRMRSRAVTKLRALMDE
jgi:RNA polymerase sigma factor (sigma-70 family)